MAVPELVDGVLAGDRASIGRALTLVESIHPGHQPEVTAPGSHSRGYDPIPGSQQRQAEGEIANINHIIM